MTEEIKKAASLDAVVKKKKKKHAKKVPLSVGKASAVAIKPGIKKKDRKHIISNYHTLMKQKEALERDSRLSAGEKKRELAAVDQKVKDLGGLEAYQQASIKGHARSTFGFNTGVWVLSVLDQLLPDWRTSESKLSLLDVGALTNHYLKQPKIDCLPIDLQPQHPSVVKKDFFDVDPADHKFDVVVLSLVINFVGDKAKRGQMLVNSHRMLKESGFLFVILPLPCVTNSRYMTHDLFVECCKGIGFELGAHKTSNKLAFFQFKRGKPPKARRRFRPKATVDGGSRNNFCIVIEPEGER